MTVAGVTYFWYMCISACAVFDMQIAGTNTAGVNSQPDNGDADAGAFSVACYPAYCVLACGNRSNF